MHLVARKPKFDYFDSFVQISNCAVQYADALMKFLEEHYDEESQQGVVASKDTLKQLEELHKIEDHSDNIVHDIVAQLAIEFVAPFDREDILHLSEALDNVVDELDDVLQSMYMYHVTYITPEVLEMARVVQDACYAVQKSCEKFTHYKKSRSIKEYIVKINDCEDLGDRTYIKSVHNLYGRAKENKFDNPLDAVGLAGVLASLERCSDACEDVADTIVTVIMKNS